MNIGILHLSDIHFTNQTNLTEKISSICSVVINELRSATRIYIVISGDIANSGNETEYTNAKKFLSLIKSLVQKEIKDIDFKLIMVPGNHDCNFSNENHLRKMTLEHVDYKTIGSDNSVFNLALSVQDDYWKFYEEYNSIPSSKIYYSITDKVGDKTICFHCFNTAWMSQLNEKPGTLFLPVSSFNKTTCHIDADISIAVYHHPVNWFNPNTELNNKNEFQVYLDKISSIQLIGHEHETIFEKRENFDNETSTLNFSGSIFNNNKDNSESGFQILLINVYAKLGGLKRYIWSTNLFTKKDSKDFIINGTYNRQFVTKKSFDDLLNEIKIPISINNKQISLNDLYIYPDIDTVDLDENEFDDYIDSESIVYHEKFKKIIVEGDSQSGKTSLLKMLFKKYYQNGSYPLLINGDKINKQDSERIIKDAFKNIYSEKDFDFDGFKQIEKKKRILLIDNLQYSKLNSSILKSITDEFSNFFEQIIISVDQALSLMPQLQSEFEDFYYFTIKPLGYKKINDLIKKYHLLKENPLIINQVILLQKTKISFDQVRQVLGDKIIPAYPVFIISILQALDYKPLNLNESSYGYCYQTLIHFALAKQAGLPNDEIDTYINYLKEFAFFLFKKDLEEIDKKTFKEFHTEYEKSFIIPEFEIVRKTLLNSQILKIEDAGYKFGYKYILYFLIAKYISEIINSEEGNVWVKKLFQNLHNEKNANILVFITHHTKEITFIEESLFSTLTPFENTTPISLEKGGQYYQLIQDIANEISNDILELNRKPEEEREKHLTRLDEINRKIEKDNSSEEEVPEEINNLMLPFYNSFRSIEIVGQIIKNRKGSLPKQKLTELITELYFLGFRTIGCLGDMFKEMKNELLVNLIERIDDGDSKHKIDQKINTFFQIISLQACLGIISKIVYSTGVKELKDIYKQVAEEIGTPVAKLVSFSINSYYNDISANEIKTLASELEDNRVAFQILKIRVKSYIYNNHVDFKKKQKIASALKMQLGSRPLKRKNY